jgi:hypothetical protein
MKLEKLLAENMLRFGVKNLSRTAVTQLYTLIEQATNAGVDINTIIANDPDEVKVGVYNDVMNWWSKHIKESAVQRSLKSWSGSTSAVQGSGSKYQDQVLSNLKIAVKNAAGVAGTTFADTINKIIQALEKNAANNAYLGLTAFQKDPFLNAFVGAYPTNRLAPGGDLTKTNSALYKSLNNLSTNFDKIWSTINTKENMVAVVAITNEDKIALMSAIQQRTDKRVAAFTNQGKQTTTAKEIKKATKIYISADKGEILSSPAGEIPEPEIRTWQRSYPDITKPDSTEMQNFYLKDNEVQVKPEQAAAFQELIKNTLADVAASGGKVVQVIYWAGSKTSKVPTMYDSKSTGYTPGGNIATGQKGNIALAAARVGAINEFLKTTLTTAFPGIPLENGTSYPEPNVGPEYTQKERDTFSARLKELPRNATDDQKQEKADLQAKYDTTYGPYKGSFGAFSLILEFNEARTTPPAGDLLTVGKWFAKITWAVKVPSDGIKPRGNVGGGQSFVGKVLDTTKCPWLK